MNIPLDPDNAESQAGPLAKRFNDTLLAIQVTLCSCGFIAYLNFSMVNYLIHGLSLLDNFSIMSGDIRLKRLISYIL